MVSIQDIVRELFSLRKFDLFVMVVLVAAIVFCIVKLVLFKKKKNNPIQKKYGRKTLEPEIIKSESVADTSALRSVEEYERIFPEFHKNRFVALAELYATRMLQFSGLTHTEAEAYRYCFSDRYYRQLCAERDRMQLNNLKSTINDLQFFSVVPFGWINEDGSDTMYVRVKYYCDRYITDLNTGKHIADAPNKRIRVETELSFRHSDANIAGVKTVVCPNCGGDVKVGKTGKCGFCGTVLNSDTYDWVLCSDNEISIIRMES